MNKTAITLGYFGLGMVAVVGVITTVIFAPDAKDDVIQFVGTIMAVASTGAVTFYMLGKQNEKVETIQKQTNGTLSKLMEENAQLQQELKNRADETSAEG
ncbi:hypothetical protein I6E74_09965 [Salinibacterium sp. SWN139]|uniref:hypothetical protein n=1 Tax=Salinibacterium sp. SWN139 TaxID=2792055 RepID=UPI0018CC8CCC|nr:hypothetical protein [Salinibacterium sp. SWN139]MBH0054490.1 hypothetical protein [Salinibacterium sp. SWN139]